MVEAELKPIPCVSVEAMLRTNVLVLVHPLSRSHTSVFHFESKMNFECRPCCPQLLVENNWVCLCGRITSEISLGHDDGEVT